MDGMMKGLFGGGDGDNDEKVSRAKDFARRYTEGDPSSGYDDDEALANFNDVIGHADADEVERATRKTLENLPASDRAQFGDFVSQLQQRDRGDAPGDGGGGGSFGIDDIAKMFGQQGGRATNAQDMFGGMLGGGGAGGAGGLGGMLGGLMGGGGSSGGGGLGGLLGGGGSNQPSAGGGMAGMLGGGMGKMILGGIAAYLIKDKLK